MLLWAVQAVVVLSGAALPADPAGVWLDVPFVRQEKNGCGAASVAMMMRYWQRQKGEPETADALEIQRAAYSPGARGIYASALERYLRRHGFRTFAFKGEWRDLRQHLEQGRPLIVALKIARGDPHYVVVTGLDWRENTVMKHDPSVRRLTKQHRADFEREWTATGNWSLLALPE